MPIHEVSRKKNFLSYLLDNSVFLFGSFIGSSDQDMIGEKEQCDILCFTIEFTVQFTGSFVEELPLSVQEGNFVS